MKTPQFVSLGHIVDNLDHLRIPLNATERATRKGDFPYWGANNIVDYIDDYTINEPVVLIGEDGAPFLETGRNVAFSVNGPIWPNNHIHVMRPLEGHSPDYIAYALNTVDYSLYVTGSTRLKLTRSSLDRIRIPYYDLPTQRRIADYLDRETAQIDAMAGALDGLVARLEERRSAVITHYVTGGHTQRRAATIPETQGSTFPATAEYLPTAQLRHYAEVNPPTTEFTLISPGDPVTFMSLDTVWPDGHADVGAEVTWTGQSHSYTPFRRGDVLLPKVSPTFSMGRATVAHTPHPVGLASSEVFVLRPRENADARFIAYAVRSTDFLAEGTASQQGVGGLRRVSSGWVGSYNFPQYDLVEQRRIADRLDAETAKIDAMIAKAGELRALLDERRSALITATVTGQHPVPEEP